MFVYVPDCINGTFSKIFLSAPRGSPSNLGGTLKTMVWRRGKVYGSHRGICVLFGLPVRAKAINVSLIISAIVCACGPIAVAPGLLILSNTNCISDACGAPNLPLSFGVAQSSWYA